MVICVCEEVVAHKTMYNTREGILEIGGGVKVTTHGNAVVSSKDCMGSIRPHNPAVFRLDQS